MLGLTAGASTVYLHEDGDNDDTEALEAYLQTGDFDIEDGQNILSIKDQIEKVSSSESRVFISGPTGSGKSTTLAAIVNEINKTRNANILTVEDPVEFIHKDKKSIVSQREVGKQTESFAQALKAALREDPDVILVGDFLSSSFCC